MLMLQQQIYQEEQTPFCDLSNHSTQFYSQYTKTSYTSSYYVNQQPWQPYGGCYQEKYQQKGFHNGYRCKLTVLLLCLYLCIVAPMVKCLRVLTANHLSITAVNMSPTEITHGTSQIFLLVGGKVVFPG